MWGEYKKLDENELKKKLSDIAFNVTQKNGTEKPGDSHLDKNYGPGIYVDILSGEPLFSSRDKYNSGSGWPSFTRPIKEDAVSEYEDTMLIVSRIEIRSSIADNHLGHVFPDGPKESTGLRYCINGAALKFIPKEEMEKTGYGDFLSYLD